MYKNTGLGSLEDQRDAFYRLYQEGLARVKTLKAISNKPNYDKDPKTFKLSEVVDIVGVSRTTIRDNERNGKIAYQDHHAGEVKQQYRLRDIDQIRQHFKKGFFDGKLERPSSLPCLTLAMAMFKGGVGKTTHASHLAAHCAIYGLKTLLVDLDPQASATLTLGYIPAVDLNANTTILGSLLEDFNEIKKVIKPTHYDNLDIITSGLELQSADICLPNDRLNNADTLGSPLLRLKQSLKLVEDQYDVIILDCAPNHAATTMNALIASDGIILPLTPTLLSYGSSIQFIQTMDEVAGAMISARDSIPSDDPLNERPLLQDAVNKLFRILVTDEEGNTAHKSAKEAIKKLYGDWVMNQSMLHTVALPRTSNNLALIYDMKSSDVTGSKESFNRGLYCMKQVNNEILGLMKTIWGVIT